MVGKWPAVGWESRPWVPQVDVPRRWVATYSGAYRSSVPPLIIDCTLDLPAPTAALASEATAALASFDGGMGADVAPFGSILLRSESASSSRIERLSASAKSVALAELGDRTRRNATEIAANTTAMRSAIELAEHLDGDAIVATQTALLGATHPEATGGWREQAVWIGSSSYGPHTAEFTPPHHELVPGLIDDLVAFMRRDDLPALVHAALAYAQFETIHPFIDGNGRTGRALLHSMLRAKGVTRSITIPVSAGLLVDVDAYFRALTEYRDGDPLPIVERLSEAVFDAVGNGRSLVEQMRRIRARWAGELTARPQAVVWRTLDLVVRQPVIDSAFIQAELGVGAQAADGAIARLVDVGALVQFTAGRRNRKYEAPEILTALDEFAERNGRRSP